MAKTTQDIPQFIPTGWWWRDAIGKADDVVDLKELARALVLELEIHKRFIRECGQIPPKATTTWLEADWLGRNLTGPSPSKPRTPFGERLAFK